VTTPEPRITNVLHRGEWYTVEGYVGDRFTSADVHTTQLTGCSRDAGRAKLARALTLVAAALVDPHYAELTREGR
jgi:hypothetical protein